MKNPTQVKLIMNWLNAGNFGAYQLSVLTGVKIASIHKRLNDLWNDGVIKQNGEFVVCGNNRKYAIYTVVSEDEKFKVIIDRNNHRKIQWILNGYTCKHITKKQRDLMLYELTEKINGNK